MAMTLQRKNLGPGPVPRLTSGNQQGVDLRVGDEIAEELQIKIIKLNHITQLKKFILKRNPQQMLL